MRKFYPIFTYLLATYLLTIVGLLHLFHQNQLRFSTGMSLARLSEVFVIPTVVALACTFIFKTGFANLGLSLESLRKHYLYLVVPMVFFTIPFILTGSDGHLGGLLFFVMGFPLFLLGSIAVSLGWFGFYAEQMAAIDFPFKHNRVSVSYGMWATTIYLCARDTHQGMSFAAVSTAVIAISACLLGYASSRLREKTESLWPVIGLHMGSYLFLSFVFERWF